MSMPLDPSTLMQLANTAQQKLFGIGQMAVGFFGGKKARRELENLQLPTYTPAKSIQDYYTQAQQRYNLSPYQSTLYNMQQQNAGRATAAGLAGLQDRRSALGGINALVQGQNDSMLKAASMAEQQKAQQFSQLGQASGMMGQEERQAFQINKMMPYEKKYNLAAMKAQAANQLLNAGMQNYTGAGQAAAVYSQGLQGMGGMNGYGNTGNYMYGGGSNPTAYTPGQGYNIDLQPSTYRVPLARY